MGHGPIASVVQYLKLELQVLRHSILPRY